MSSVKIMQSLAAKMELDRASDRSTYKREKRAYIAQWMESNEDIETFTLAIANLGIKYQDLYNKYAALPNTTTKPKITETMSVREKMIAYLPYNNGQDMKSLIIGIGVAENLVDQTSKKVYTKVIDALLESYLDSMKGKYLGETIINTVGSRLLSAFGFNEFEHKVLAGYLVEMVQEAGLLTRRKIGNSDQKGASFFVKMHFEETFDLYATRRFTDKDRVKFTIPQDITRDSFIISQRKWRYEQPKVGEALIKTINKKNSTPVCFADWVTAEHIEQIVREKLHSEKLTSIDWIETEVSFALAEFQDIMDHGNKFYIDRFVDSANRIYERKGHIGFQEGSPMRCLLRFHNKKVVTPAGRLEYKAQLDEHYGEGQWQSMSTADDKWGWLEAYRSRTKPTGAIVYDDATSQALGIYGLATGDDILLNLGGFNANEDFSKGYQILAKLMNQMMTDYYGHEVVCFTGHNLKNAFMTTVYNVSMTRVMTGRSGMDEADQANAMLVEMGMPELVSEYEDDTSKLGKLEPLLMTVRGAGLDIAYEVLEKFYELSTRALARAGLKLMDTINSLVKDNETTDVFKWHSLDGVANQFAMVDTVKISVPWITGKGKKHSYTDFVKTLTPGSAWRGLAPRIIQSIDAYLMRYVTNNISFDMIGIHDSFGSHGNDAAEKRMVYLSGCANIFAFDAVGNIVREISGRNIRVQPANLNRSAIIERILNSTNAITK